MTKTRRRVIYVFALAVAAAAAVMAFLLTPEPEAPSRPDEIVAVSPAENASEVRQVTVFAEVAGNHDTALVINGTEIPDDQLDRIQTGAMRVTFVPGEDKEFERFPAGRNCARIEWWPRGQDRVNTSKAYAWCFTLQ